MTNARIWCELCVDSQQRTKDEYLYRILSSCDKINRQIMSAQKEAVWGGAMPSEDNLIGRSSLVGVLQSVR